MKRLVLTFLFCLLAGNAQAVTYYVAKSADGGSDANSCATAQTHTSGKLTIAAGIACMSAGDTLKIKAGTYNEQLNNLIPAGTSGAPTTVEAYDSANKPVVQLNSASSGQMVRVARAWIILKNLKLDGLLNLMDPIKVDPGGDDLVMDGLEVYRGGYGNSSSRPNVTIADNVQRTTLKNCKVYDSYSSHNVYWRGSNGTIEHCEFYFTAMADNDAHQIQVYSQGSTPSSNTIRFNVFRDGNKGVLLAGGGSHKMYGNLLYNHTRGTDDRAIYITSGNNEVYHNTIYGNGNEGILNASSTAIIKNNITAGNGTNQSGTGLGTWSNNSTSAACMIDPATNDFNLVEGSACIDGGTAASVVSGFTCVGAACDIGAFEAPIRSNAVVEDATDTIYRITFSLPTQSTRDGTGLQTCTVGNIALTENTGGGDVGKTENSCSTSASASRVDVTVSAAYTAASTVKDAYTRSATPTLMDNVAIGFPGGTLGTNYFNAKVRTYSATAGTNSVDGGALPAFTQTRYRFHKLRGTEASPSLLNAAATENVSVTLPPGAAFRLRVKIRTDDDPAATTFKLRYSKDGGAYTDIPDSIGADFIGWHGVTGDTDIPAAGSATTELLTSDEATNVACAVVRTSSDYPLLDFNNGESECEYVLKTSTSVTVGTTYDFRVYKSDNTALDTYTVTPRLTVGSYTSFGF